MASAKLAVIRIRPAVRPSGVSYHTHEGSTKPCYCRVGTDEVFAQAVLAVKTTSKEAK